MNRFGFVALLLALSSARAELPPLIPREVLFGNPARAHPEISPDGAQIAWLAPDKKGVLNVWASAIDGENPHPITNEAHRPIAWYAWGGDAKHILYLQDNAGDENQHLFSADLTTSNVRDLTPFRGVRAQNVLTDSQHPRFVVVAQNPQSDVAEHDEYLAPKFLANPTTNVIEAVLFDYTTGQWVFLDAKMEADFAKIGREVAGFIDLISRDRADRKWIIAARRSDAPASYYVFDRETKKVTLLYNENPALQRSTLAPKKSVIIKARDGLELVSYLTTPPRVEAKNLPLVLLIHGGPWDRDDDNYDPVVQFLANRGYAVLQVNYRGSTGFGIDFFNAGNSQLGRGMQQDLYDAVQWAIDQKIADPKRVAAMGGSVGGFATLCALEMRPDLFACGVDVVGPSDQAANFRSFPSYWSIVMPRWRRRGGDFDHDEELNRKVSPLYHVDKIRAPLLIGQGKNDPRVAIATSDAMVAALRKAKREVVYVVYSDEGHGFERPENNFDFYGRVEEFLAKHLGGRAEPWKKIADATAEAR